MRILLDDKKVKRWFPQNEKTVEANRQSKGWVVISNK